LPVPEDADDLALLVAAARKAGEIALRFWKQSPETWDKGDGQGPVTEADLAVNTLLASELRGARPDYGWLSEETPDDLDRLHRARTFIIDPIDGTRAFIAGEDTFAHSLAIAEAGQITAGVVFLPALGRLYAAHRAGPALRDGVPIRPSGRVDLLGASLLTPKSTMAPDHWPGGVPNVTRAFRPSLAFRLCLVAEGRHDAMATFRPAWEWDIAAGSLIASRAGAVATDGQGAPLRFNARDPRTQGALVGSPAIHEALLAQRTTPQTLHRSGY
jgi:myo-inositol-1(or 4)-monophosphatase